MKHLQIIMVFLILCVPVLAEDFVVTEAEYIVISGNVSDTLGRTRLTPDSIRVVVSDSAGTELFDAWFESADAQATLNGDVITFFDQWEDINGAADVGVFSIMATIASDAQNNVDLFSNYNYTLRGVTVGVEQTHNEVGDILDTLQNQDNWAGTGANQTLIIDTVNGIMDTLQNQDSWVAQQIAFDSLKYIGSHGLGIYLDSAAANTNTVIGTDGTYNNPVSTLVAARTLSDALGVKRYYIINKSTFNSAANDLAADHQNFEFIGTGSTNAMAFGGQRVDGSRFDNLTLSGAMHASGGNVLYERCMLGFITANFNGTVDNCWLTDTIVAKNGRDLQFHDCQSGVAGNATPTIDLSGGQSSLSMRNYSGGVRIQNGSSDDTVSVETDGQVIIASSNTSLTISLRGNMTITDNGTTTAITKDAVFSRQETVTPIIDTVNGIIDSLQSQDDWVAREASLAGASQQALEDVGYNSTDSTLDLTQLKIVASGNDNAFDITGSGTGEAISATGGATGGSGIGIDGGAAGDGINIRTTSGQAIDAEGTGGSNAAVILSGPGGSWDNTNTGILIEDTLTDGELVAFMPDDFTAADSAGYQGSAAGLDSAGVQGAVIAAINVDTTMRLKSLYVINDDADTPSVFIHNGTGHGMQVNSSATGGRGLYLSATNGYSLFSNHRIQFGKQVTIGGENDDSASFFVFSTGTQPAVEYKGTGGPASRGMFVHSDSSDGAKFEATGSNETARASSGIWADGKGWYDIGFKMSQSSEDTLHDTSSLAGRGMWITSLGSGDAVVIQTGTPSDTAAGVTLRTNFAAQVEGAVSMFTREGSDHTFNETALQIHGKRQGQALVLLSDSATQTARISGGLTSKGLVINGGSTSGNAVEITGVDTGIHFSTTDLDINSGQTWGLVADSVDRLQTTNHGSGSWQSGSAGSGANAIRYYAVDTSAIPDDSLMGVGITVRTMAGVLEAALLTNSFGYVDFTLPTDSFVVLGNRTRFTFERDTIDVTGEDSLSLVGYQSWSAPTPPANTNLSTVHGFTYSLQEVGIASAQVKFWPAETPIFNICDTSVIMIPQEFFAPTDDTGLFSIDLMKSSCMKTKRTGGTNIEWKVKITTFGPTGEAASREHTFEIPSDSSTYFLSF